VQYGGAFGVAESRPMPRYYLNLYNDVDTIDEEGVVYPDVGAAKTAAIQAARGVMAENVKIGRALTLHHRIEVADEQGKILAVLPFYELITINE
jgi:hypothetical protein